MGFQGISFLHITSANRIYFLYAFILGFIVLSAHVVNKPAWVAASVVISFLWVVAYKRAKSEIKQILILRGAFTIFLFQAITALSDFIASSTAYLVVMVPVLITFIIIFSRIMHGLFRLRNEESSRRAAK